MIAAAIRTNVRPWTPTVYAEPPFRTGLPSPVQEQFCFFRPHPARDCPAPCKKNKKSARTPPAPTGPAPPRAGTNKFFGPGPLRPMQKQKNLQGKLFSASRRKEQNSAAGRKHCFSRPRRQEKTNCLPFFSLRPDDEKKQICLSIFFLLTVL